MKQFSILDMWVPWTTEGRNRRRAGAVSPVDVLDACQLSDSVKSNAGNSGCYLSRPY